MDLRRGEEMKRSKLKLGGDEEKRSGARRRGGEG